MNSLRHLLLVAVLLFAQLAAGAHAIEHVAGNEGGLLPHTCELCLAAHDLGSALPSVVALLPVTASHQVPKSLTSVGRNAFPAPRASQRAPPFA